MKKLKRKRCVEKIECKRCDSYLITSPGDVGQLEIFWEDKFGGKQLIGIEKLAWNCKCGKINFPSHTVLYNRGENTWRK